MNEKLFERAGQDVRKLRAQAKKELRAQQRKQWKGRAFTLENVERAKKELQ